MKPQKINNVGRLYVSRSEKFEYKQIVSDFLEKLISLSVSEIPKKIDRNHFVPFLDGEHQIHTIIVPALVKLADWVTMEYTVIRGIEESNGRVDYYCINNIGQKSEYNLLVELKCGRQGIPSSDRLRDKNVNLWKEANEQLVGLTNEIKNNKSYYNTPVVRVCMEVVILYADKCKNDRIDITELHNTHLTAVEVLKQHTDVKPNFSALLEFNSNIVEKAVDEYRPNRQFHGMLFLCRIMPPI